MVRGDAKNELKTRFNKEKSITITWIGIESEDREYSKDEIKTFSNSIGDYIFSKSSKNGDIAKTFDKYGDVQNIFVRNEK